MSEEISQDTKCSPEPNKGLKSSDTQPTNIYDLGKQLVAEFQRVEAEHDPNLVKMGEDDPLLTKWGYIAAGYFNQATTAQSEQIAALEAKNKQLEQSLDEHERAMMMRPPDVEFVDGDGIVRIARWNPGEPEVGIPSGYECEDEYSDCVAQVAALTADNARLREAMQSILWTLEEYSGSEKPCNQCSYDLQANLYECIRCAVERLVGTLTANLSQPPAGPSGLLRLVRDALAVNEAYAALADSTPHYEARQQRLFNALDKQHQAGDDIGPALKAAAARGQG